MDDHKFSRRLNYVGLAMRGEMTQRRRMWDGKRANGGIRRRLVKVLMQGLKNDRTSGSDALFSKSCRWYRCSTQNLALSDEGCTWFVGGTGSQTCTTVQP